MLYKTFLSCKPPEFAGTTEPIRCIRWLKEMETIFDACDCLENQRIKYATRLLKDETVDWWELIRSSLTPENLARLSWAEFKEKLMEKYCGQRALDKIENEFRAMKKGNLSISYYAKQFLEKLSLVKHLAPDENSKIKAYLRGLPVDMRTTVRISKVTTLNEAIEESLRLEDDKCYFIFIFMSSSLIN